MEPAEIGRWHGTCLPITARPGREHTMTDKTNDWTEEFWYRGKVTRRRLIGYGTAAGSPPAPILVPAPGRAAFGQGKHPKTRAGQPRFGAAAAGRHNALVRAHVALDPRNQSWELKG